MKNAITSCAAAALLVLAASLAGTASADEIDTIKARGTLICGVGSNTVPFSYIEDPQTRKNVGYDIDLCEAVAKTLGVKPELKFVTTATRIPEVQQGRVDLALASVTITPERQELISFSYPHLVTGTAIITPASRPMKALSDMENKRVSVIEGGAHRPGREPEDTGRQADWLRDAGHGLSGAGTRQGASHGRRRDDAARPDALDPGQIRDVQ